MGNTLVLRVRFILNLSHQPVFASGTCGWYGQEDLKGGVGVQCRCRGRHTHPNLWGVSDTFEGRPCIPARLVEKRVADMSVLVGRASSQSGVMS